MRISGSVRIGEAATHRVERSLGIPGSVRSIWHRSVPILTSEKEGYLGDAAKNTGPTIRIHMYVQYPFPTIFGTSITTAALYAVVVA